MARGELILRQWNLLRTLHSRGAGTTLRELSESFGVSERTIQRDLEILHELGVPISHEADEVGRRYWRLPHDYFRAGPLALSVTEALSLELAEHLVAPLSGTLFADGWASVRNKLRSLIPARALEYFRGLDEVVYVKRRGSTDYAEHAETIQRLAQAIRSSRTVSLAYRSLWRRDAYRTSFDPYGLVVYDGDLFTIGRSHRASALRVLKVARISSVALSEVAFSRPQGFQVEEQFEYSFGVVRSEATPVEVAVRFTGPSAALVEERTWHESQRIEWPHLAPTLFEEDQDAGDALIATFHLGATAEFKRWILSFGPDAEVLRPDSLRAEIRNELAAAMARYVR